MPVDELGRHVRLKPDEELVWVRNDETGVCWHVTRSRAEKLLEALGAGEARSAEQTPGLPARSSGSTFSLVHAPEAD
jgi:hypothetical protein